MLDAAWLHRRVDLLSWLLLAALLAIAPGCASVESLDDESKLPTKREGEIPSTAFVLTAVTDTKSAVGGWWAGCLRLGLQRPADATKPDLDKTLTCVFEYGTPMVTEKFGRTSERRAKEIAAEATNHAMATVPRTGRMTSDICGDMAAVMRQHVDDALEGSRVNQGCGTTFGQVPEVSWP